ncbi:MAG: hypothetical protein Ct9H300mP30_1350 [Methanobacteriota archaeon]|nr:MAG: hypothetical protein Ct9H300mP30_1350 [Euryarchaeota archaeon]
MALARKVAYGRQGGPSPSRLLMMKTGEPLLILADIALVTACRGIEPLASTAASLLRIL